MTHRFTATAQRDGDWWIVQCDQWPAALSQVRRLDQAAEANAEAIAFVADLPEGAIEVDVRVVLPAELEAELEEADGLAQAARHDNEVASQKRRKVARALSKKGYTVRDIGAVFKVSHQRAHQLISND